MSHVCIVHACVAQCALRVPPPPASGVAVMMVMLITTLLVSLIMIVKWQVSLFFMVPFLLFFAFIEGSFLSANLFKVNV